MSSSGYSFHYHFFAFTFSSGILCSVVSEVRMDELNALENRGCELFSVYNFITEWGLGTVFSPGGRELELSLSFGSNKNQIGLCLE